MARNLRLRDQGTSEHVATGQEPPRVWLLSARIGFASVAVLLTLIMALSPLLGASQSNGQERPRVPVIIEPGVRGPSVVLVDPAADPADVAADNGVIAERVFRRAASAFETNLDEVQVQTLANDERVRAIVIDHEIEAAEIQTGVERIAAPGSTYSTIGTGATTNIGIAIIDSGVSSHPDLNVVGGTSCATGSSYADVNGHGTHVAGIAAARDNGSGVVGVAPGASIYSVRVLEANGRGTISNLICGLEWVLENSGSISVVNMSLTGPGTGGSCESHALHQAVCNVANAGIIMVAAAGNYGNNTATYIPALYPEVITVSSFTDTNGRPGGGGAPCRGSGDDYFSSFSNWGPDVDIMAPGGCIYSTVPGGYGTNSGTSMAAPHVAGALAAYIANGGGGDPVGWLLSSGSVPQNSPNGILGGASSGERVLYLGGSGVPATATPTRQATATPTRQAGTATPTATTGARPPRPGRGTATPTTQATSTPTRAATNTPGAGPTNTPTRVATATPTATTGARPPRPGRGTATATSPAQATSTPTRAAGATATPTTSAPTRPPRTRSTSIAPTATPSAGDAQPDPSSAPTRAPRTRWTSQADVTATAVPTEDTSAVIRSPRSRGEATEPAESTATTETESSESGEPSATEAPSWPTATPTSVMPTATPTEVPPTSTPEPAPTEPVIDEAPSADEAPVDEIPVEDAPIDEPPIEDEPIDEVPVDEVPVEEPTVVEAPSPVPFPVYDVTDTEDQDTAWYAVDSNLETTWYLTVPAPVEAPIVEEPTVVEASTELPVEEGTAEDGTERERSREGSEGSEGTDESAPVVEQAPQAPVEEPEDLHLTIDLGSEQQLGSVRWLMNDHRYADSMEIQVSLDGETWTTVAWPADIAEWQVLEGEWQEADLYGTSARYVRFMFPNWNGDDVVGGITEVEVLPIPVIVE